MGSVESKTIEVKGIEKPRTPPVNKRILGGFDPRSPSTGIDRTPIQVVKNHIVVDPRSPSVDITRTPIVFEKTQRKVTVSDIRREIQAFKKESNISEVNLNEATDIKKQDNTSKSINEENTESLVEALERSVNNTMPVETQDSKDEESETTNLIDTPPTLEGASSEESETNNVLEISLPSLEGAISDDIIESESKETEEVMEEEVENEENESVFVDADPVAIGGLEEMNTPQFEKELCQMMEQKSLLAPELGLEEDAAIMTVATETNGSLRMRKPRKSHENRDVNRRRALMSSSSPQRSPLCVINATSSPKALCRRKLSVNGSINKTPQSPLMNKRRSAGQTPSRLVGVMVDKENM